MNIILKTVFIGLITGIAFEAEDKPVREVLITPAHLKNAPGLQFWDAIPHSPSTTMPGEIESDDYWYGQFQRVNTEVAAADNTKVVFFGDSTTWLWSESGDGAYGKDVWKEYYSIYNPINMGNSGDITPVMLYRVTHGNLDFPKGQEPKVAVLLCGINNFVVTQSAGGKVKWALGPTCPPEDVANGARAVAQVFRRRLPRTRVIMMGILPVSPENRWAKVRQANAVNAALACNNNEVFYLDLMDKFLQPDGSINGKLFADNTHPNAAGYRVWAQSLEPILSEMLKDAPLNPVKIMPIGDLITEGISSSGSYRRYLDGMLRRSGQIIDFVGNRTKHNDNLTEPDSYEYDVDHEGHWGKDSDWLAQNMAGLISSQVPDVALIHMGTEDIVSHNGGADLVTERILENIGMVIDALRSKNDSIRIVLARIIPIRGKIDKVNLLNIKISKYAKAQSTAKSPIVIADQQTGFSVSSDLVDDGVLPNAAGAEKMAAVFARAIPGIVKQK